MLTDCVLTGHGENLPSGRTPKSTHILLLPAFFMKTLRFSILAALVLSAGISAHAADWPAYRGPDGDGISSETLPKKVVPSQPVWMVETNLGFSSFSVAAGKAYTIVIREIDGNPMEICLALDAATGEEEWAAPLWLGGQYDGGGKSGAKGNDGGDG